MPADYTIDGYSAPAHVTIDQIHPRSDILLVRRIKAEELTAGGLHIPEIARNPASGIRIGEVLKVGPGDEIGRRKVLDFPEPYGYIVDHAEPFCKPGDRVAYMRTPDNDVNIGGVDCVFLREEQHVLAILEHEDFQ